MEPLILLKVYTSQSLKLRLRPLFCRRSNLLVQPLGYRHDRVKLFSLFGRNGERMSQLRAYRIGH